MISLTATGTQHLFKDSNSKRYYFREQRDGKDIKKSLRTKDYDTAVKKLRELQSKAPAPANSNTSVVGGLIEEWRIRAEARIASKKLKARSQEYNEECLASVTGNQSGTIKATWPGFVHLRVSAIRNRDLLLYLPVAAKIYCATRVNGSLTVLRQLFALAIEMGIIRASDNPIIGIKNLPVPPGDCAIPTQEQMIVLRDEVYRRSQSAGIMLDFLVFSGSRIKAAIMVTWGDVDWGSGTIHFRHTKRKSYRVTILPEMHALLRRLQAAGQYKLTDPILKTKGMRKALENAIDFLNRTQSMHIPHMSNHTFRHYFSAQCLTVAQGDVFTVSRWLGHVDGGKLLLGRYGHLVDKHSKALALKMRFFNGAADTWFWEI